MATSTRRPLPAFVFLLVLGVISAIVWWRVLQRPDDSEANPSPSTIASPAVCQPGTHTAVVLPQPAEVGVRVLNGAPERAGLAASIAAQLRALGFANTTVGGNTGTLSRSGEIRYGPAGRLAATRLSYYVPGTALVPIKRSDAGLDLVLGPTFARLVPKAIAAVSEAKAATTC